jgi:hypothetical protein
MDTALTDKLFYPFKSGISRRGVLAILASGLLVARQLADRETSAAKKRNRKKKKGKNKNSQTRLAATSGAALRRPGKRTAGQRNARA